MFIQSHSPSILQSQEWYFYKRVSQPTTLNSVLIQWVDNGEKHPTEAPFS